MTARKKFDDGKSKEELKKSIAPEEIIMEDDDSDMPAP